MPSPEAILYGHLCRDRIPGTETIEPGSPAWYMGNTLHEFGIQTAVISPYGNDYPRDWLAPEIVLVPDKPTTLNTLLYENQYAPDGTRTQRASHYGEALLPEPVSLDQSVFENAKAVIVCPILDNIPVGYLTQLRRQIPDAQFVLLPQGYFRHIDDMGRVTQQAWRDGGIVSTLFNTIIVSELDGPNIHAKGNEWSKRSEANIIVTQAANGSVLYNDGTATHIHPFPIGKEVHPTGAGDVFAAAYVYDTLRHQNTSMQSILFASAAAAIHVSGQTVTIPRVHELIAKSNR